MTPRSAIATYLEAGDKHVFAGALDWPGWARRAKTDEAAVEALADYTLRYAAVVERAGLHIPGGAVPTFDVVERIAATPGATFSNVDFGALGVAAARDREALTLAQAGRLADIVEASWSAFHDVASRAPAQLRKGPRGGGRDTAKVVAHVVAAEAAYARKLGVRHKTPAADDVAAVAAMRADIAGVLRASRAADDSAGWLPRYAARRIAWHVLDHLWEIEDRSS